jgi:hypothetical protein
MIELLIGLVLGLVIGWKASVVFYKKIVKDLLIEAGVDRKDMTKLQDLARKESPMPELAVRVERIGDCLYAYRKDTNEFLGWGEDSTALFTAIGQRIDNVEIIIAAGDGMELLSD